MFQFNFLVWCQVVLIVTTWLWYFCFIPLLFLNLPKMLSGYLSLTHFRFLLSLANYFLILLFVSVALSPDIF